MPIRADVGRLERIASKLRSCSNKLEDERATVNNKVQSMDWAGNVYRYFMEEFHGISQSMRETANDMEDFARRLENLADQFRQEDIEEERREREREERERQRRLEARMSRK